MIKCDASEIARWSATIAKLPAEFAEAVYGGIDKSVVDMEKTAKFAIPVDHGDLRDSIEIVDGNTAIHERSVTVGDDALDYAIPLEFGHINKDGSHTPPAKFWRSATRVVNKRHKARMRRTIRKVYRKFYPVS